MPCSFEQEHLLLLRGISPVAGIDEAGRGPLAGPVVAAAVILPLNFRLPGLDDSKKLTPGMRESLYAALTGNPEVCWASAHLDHEEVDRWNILGATHRAMRKAFLALVYRPLHALIDGLPVPNFPCPHTALTGGDGRSLSIAAASIVAKVERDRMMREFDRKYPEYGFSKHKGYPTPDHLAKLREHGPCQIHRRSFSPVAQSELF